MSVAQKSIIENLNLWLIRKGRKADLDKGHCSGFAALWGFYKARGDAKAYFALIKKIANWDGLSAAHDAEFETFINDLKFLQWGDVATQLGLPIEQAAYDKLYALAGSSEGALGKCEYRLDFVFKKAELADAIKRVIIAENKVVRIASTDHAVGLVYAGGKYCLYDSNSKYGDDPKAKDLAIEYDTPEQVADALQKLFLSNWPEVMVTPVKDAHIPISMHIFNMAGTQAVNYPAPDKLVSDYLEARDWRGEPAFIKTWDNHDALWMAARRGEPKIVEALVARADAPVYKSKERVEALLLAVSSSRKDEDALFLAFYPKYKKELTKINQKNLNEFRAVGYVFEEKGDLIAPYKANYDKVVDEYNQALVQKYKAQAEEALVDEIQRDLVSEAGLHQVTFKTTKAELAKKRAAYDIILATKQNEMRIIKAQEKQARDLVQAPLQQVVRPLVAQPPIQPQPQPQSEPEPVKVRSETFVIAEIAAAVRAQRQAMELERLRQEADLRARQFRQMQIEADAARLRAQAEAQASAAAAAVEARRQQLINIRAQFAGLQSDHAQLKVSVKEASELYYQTKTREDREIVRVNQLHDSNSQLQTALKGIGDAYYEAEWRCSDAEFRAGTGPGKRAAQPQKAPMPAVVGNRLAAVVADQATTAILVEAAQLKATALPQVNPQLSGLEQQLAHYQALVEVYQSANGALQASLQAVTQLQQQTLARFNQVSATANQFQNSNSQLQKSLKGITDAYYQAEARCRDAESRALIKIRGH
jgi:hypothetical protein